MRESGYLALNNHQGLICHLTKKPNPPYEQTSKKCTTQRKIQRKILIYSHSNMVICLGLFFLGGRVLFCFCWGGCGG